MKTAIATPNNVKQAYYVTLGAVALLEQKTTNIIDTLIKEGEKSEKEWNTTIQTYRTKVEKNGQEIKKTLEGRYQKVLQDFGIEKNVKTFQGNVRDISDKVYSLLWKPEPKKGSKKTAKTPTSESASEAEAKTTH